jgi:hypothetical protein
MPKQQYKFERFQVRITPETIAVLKKERGTIPMCTYITEVLSKYAIERINKEKEEKT